MATEPAADPIVFLNSKSLIDLSFARLLVIDVNKLMLSFKTADTTSADFLRFDSFLSERKLKISALDKFFPLKGNFSDAIVSSNSLIQADLEVILFS